MSLKWVASAGVLAAVVVLGVVFALPQKQTPRHSIKLEWERSPSPGVEGYNVYRYTCPDGPFAGALFQKVNDKPVPAAGLVFVDEKLVQHNTHYCYFVTAVRGKDESPPSKQFSVFFP